jgi:hypothetical protein
VAPPNQPLEFTRLVGDTFAGCLLKMLRREYTGPDRPCSLEPPFEFNELRG